MATDRKPNMKKWSQAKLDMEIAFAGWALDGSPVTMTRAGILALALALAACAAQPKPWDSAVDGEGYVYPDDCRQDLSWVQSSIVRVPRADISLLRESLGLGYQSTNGYYHPATGQIVVASDLYGWRYDDTVHHERCHAIMGDWHK